MEFVHFFMDYYFLNVQKICTMNPETGTFYSIEQYTDLHYHRTKYEGIATRVAEEFNMKYNRHAKSTTVANRWPNEKTP